MQIGLAAIQAAGAIYSARSQQAMYNAQAEQARLQGRDQAIQYQQQGAFVLRRLNETLAATIATAAAGSVDPFSGSAQVLQDFARAEAYAEFGTTKDNAILAREGAKLQAQIYKMAGKSAYTTGIINAVGIMGEGIQKQLSLSAGATAAPGGGA